MTLQTHFIRVPKSYLHCGTQHQSWQATKLWSNMFFWLWILFSIRVYNSNDSHYLHVRFASLAQWLERCALSVRDCRFWSKRCAFAQVAKAHQHFLNLWNRNHFFPRAIIDCLREAKSFLQIDRANESFFAKTVQRFTMPYNFQGGADWNETSERIEQGAPALASCPACNVM